MVTLDALRDVLLWCSVINFGLLLWWFLLFITAHDWVYRLHSKWFGIPREQFDMIHYTGMAWYKLGILLFNLVPFIALHIVG